MRLAALASLALASLAGCPAPRVDPDAAPVPLDAGLDAAPTPDAISVPDARLGPDAIVTLEDAPLSVDADSTDAALGPDAAVSLDAAPTADARALDAPSCVPGSSYCERSYRLHVCGPDGVDVATTCPRVCAGDPPACLECMPDASSCRGDDIVRCRADGSGQDVVRTCPAGCDLGRCRFLEPVNLARNSCERTGLPDLTISADTTHSTDTCALGTIEAQVPSGAMACVMRFANVGIAAGATLRFTGTLPPIVLATGDVMLDGVIDVSANGTMGGVAAVTTGVGGAPVRAHDGAGGGGSATVGGAGGGPGGAGGSIYSDERSSPLVGGSPGASAGTSLGGGGGGALELAVCGTLTFGPAAVIDASGGGGRAGACAASCTGGGGGGSGGTVVLACANILYSATARVVANGGAGGSGASVGVAGVDGEDGRRDVSPASSGGSVPGGAGSYLGTGPTSGVTAATPSATSSSGGGGGAAGRIRYGEVSLSPEPMIWSPYPSIVGSPVH